MPEQPDPNAPPVTPPPAGQNWNQPPTQTGTSGSQSNSPMEQLIPAKNVNALLAYYCGVFSLIPCLGLLLGIVAVFLGFKGKQACERDPSMPGKAHAWVGIVLGSITFLGNLTAIILIALNTRLGA